MPASKQMVLSYSDYIRSSDPIFNFEVIMFENGIYRHDTKTLYMFNGLDWDVDYFNNYDDGGLKNSTDFEANHLQATTKADFDFLRDIEKPHRVVNRQVNIAKTLYFLGNQFPLKPKEIIEDDEHTSIMFESKAFNDTSVPLCLLSNAAGSGIFRRFIWNRTDSDGVYTPCPECKDRGHVLLLQFKYNCSICGDGKRL